DGDRVEERLTWRERDQLVLLPEVLRQRRQEEVIDPVVLEVAGRDRHHEHRDRDDQPRAQLVQMLDEGELVVWLCALDPRHWDATPRAEPGRAERTPAAACTTAAGCSSAAAGSAPRPGWSSRCCCR